MAKNITPARPFVALFSGSSISDFSFLIHDPSSVFILYILFRFFFIVNGNFIYKKPINRTSDICLSWVKIQQQISISILAFSSNFISINFPTWQHDFHVRRGLHIYEDDASDARMIGGVNPLKAEFHSLKLTALNSSLLLF